MNFKQMTILIITVGVYLNKPFKRLKRFTLRYIRNMKFIFISIKPI